MRSTYPGRSGRFVLNYDEFVRLELELFPYFKKKDFDKAYPIIQLQFTQ